MTRHKITVTEITELPKVATNVAGTVGSGTSTSFAEVFSQTFDEFNLRAFVTQINATPRRRRKTAKGKTT